MQDKIKLTLNFNVFKDKEEQKEILRIWEEFLNRDFRVVDDANLRYWVTSERFFAPNRFLSDLYTVKANLKYSQITVVGLFPVGKDTFNLKTMFSSTYDSGKKHQLEYIYSVYVIKTGEGFKFMSSPQWYFDHWEKKDVGSISYCFDKNRPFNPQLGVRLDSFNRSMSRLFKSDVQLPIYFVGKNVFEAYQFMGYDYNAEQATFSQQGAYTESLQKIVFAGNGTEYYPHEIVHLYTGLFWGKDDIYYHQWFNEGIAVFLGGYQGYPVEWHLKKLKKYLDEHPQEPLNDISTFYFTVDGEYRTNFMYEIGGLICKRIYEAKGMDGLFDLLKSGSTDDDFYKAIEKHFGVKKANFGTFIRNELKKM